MCVQLLCTKYTETNRSSKVPVLSHPAAEEEGLHGMVERTDSTASDVEQSLRQLGLKPATCRIETQQHT